MILPSATIDSTKCYHGFARFVAAVCGYCCSHRVSFYSCTGALSPPTVFADEERLLRGQPAFVCYQCLSVFVSVCLPCKSCTIRYQGYLDSCMCEALLLTWSCLLLIRCHSRRSPRWMVSTRLALLKRHIQTLCYRSVCNK